MAWLERHVPHLILVFSVLALAGGLLSASLQNSDAEPIAFQSGSRFPDGTPIRVHVSGSVEYPGVYDFAEGDRVVDAIETAGGATATADVEALNLARRLRDGEQLEVPSRGGTRSSGTTEVAGANVLDIVDINVATEAELDSLPGIGEAYSRRIVDSRTVDGPFESLDDLAKRRVIPASTLEAIRHLITAGP